MPPRARARVAPVRQAECTTPLAAVEEAAEAAGRNPPATKAPSCAVNATPIQQSPTVNNSDDPGYASLKHAACADSFHDFGHGGKNFNKLRDSNSPPGLTHVINALNNIKWPSIPKSRGEANGLRDENAMLSELFAGAAESDFTETKQLVTAIENAGGSLLLDLQHTTYGAQQYDVKLLKHGEGAAANYDTGSRVDAAKITTADVYELFGKNTINLLFDASVINVTNRLVSAEVAGADAITVNRIINREIVNDPAPKTYEKSTSDKAAEENTGNTYNILFENNKDDITYVSNPADLLNNELQRNKFFSKFDLTLSPLSSNHRDSLPRISMTITDPNARESVIYNNDDPHQNNNIAKCWNRIKNLDKKAGAIATSAALQEMGVHFQCKRSGDWLQALSCLDTGRPYLDSDGHNYVLENDNIILVTHDRILLWYALFMGIDVILTWKDTRVEGTDSTAPSDSDIDEENAEDEDADASSKKRLIYFNNARRAASPEERHLRMVDIAETLYNLSDGLITYINQYNSWLQNIKAARRTALNKLREKIPTTNSSEVIARDNFSDYIQNLIKAYWQYYSMTYIPMDTTEIIALRKEFVEARTSFLPIKEAYRNNAFAPAAANYTSELENCSKMATKFISKCRAIQFLQMRFETQSAIVSANERLCSSDEIYSNIPLIGALRLTPRIRKPAQTTADRAMAYVDGAVVAEPLTMDQRVAMLATHFVDKAEPIDIQLLYNYIDNLTIKEGYILSNPGKWVDYLVTKAAASYIPLFLLTLRAGFPMEERRSVAPDRQDLARINAVLRDEADENKDMFTDASREAAADAPAAAAAAAEAEEARLASAAEADEEGVVQTSDEAGGVAAAAAEAAAPVAAAARPPAAAAAAALLPEKIGRSRAPVDVVKNGLQTAAGGGCDDNNLLKCEGVTGNTATGTIGRFRVFLNSASTRLNLAKYFSLIIPYFTRARGGAQDGGNPDVVKHTAYYTMFNFYMLELTSQLGSFETAENEDYIYYDALARLVLAVTANKDNAPDNLRYSRYVSYLYEQIPQLTKETGLSFYTNGDFMSKVAFVGRNVALQSLSKASSDMPSLAYGATTNVPLISAEGQTYTSPYSEEYNRLKVELKRDHAKFADRQRVLCLELLNRVEMSASPDSPEFGQTAAAAVAQPGESAAPVAEKAPLAVSPAPSLDYATIVKTLKNQDITKMPPASAKVVLNYIQEMIARGEINTSTIAYDEQVMYNQLVKRAAKATLHDVPGSKNGTRGITIEREAGLAGGRRSRKIRGGARHMTRKQRGYKKQRGSTRGSRRQRN